MAKRGRRPKPAALHVLEGTLNKTRHVRDRGAEPVADGDLLAAPLPGLSESQSAAWAYAVEHAPRGILRRIDRGVLYIWVEAEDRHRRAVEAQARLDARNPSMPFLLVRKGSKQLVVSPYLGIISQAAQTMLRAASELGFSPAARPRLAPTNPGVIVANDSPWKKLRLLQGGAA